jgi:UPF0042 nucleotide-binding protein
MSGAGKTVALQHLEDNGFFCMDNFPPILCEKLIELLLSSISPINKIAIVIDLRGGKFFMHLFQTLSYLKKHPSINSSLWFLDTSTNELIRRYKKTRRRHPLKNYSTLLESIDHERELLQKIRLQASLILDTSKFSSLELKKQLALNTTTPLNHPFVLTLLSFGFKHGLPLDADLVFDVRFLPNPYYCEKMRLLDGREQDVSDYVLNHEDTQLFLAKLEELLLFLLPRYKQEGKQQLIVALGCTGGQHRSVAIAVYLKQQLEKRYPLKLTHRDLSKKVKI